MTALSFHRRKLPSFSGNSVPIFNHPQTKKCVLLSFSRYFPFFTLCQLPVTIHYWEESGSLSFTYSDQIALSLPFPRLDSLCYHSSFLHEKCSSHLTILLAFHKPHSAMSTSLLYWRAQNCKQHFRCSLISAEEGENPFLVPAGSTSPNVTLSAVSLNSYDGASLAHLSAFFSPEPQDYHSLQSCLPVSWPKNVQEHWVVSSQVLEFALPHLELLHVSPWPILSLLMFLWMPAKPPGVSASSETSADLLRVHSASPSRFLIKS